MPLTHKPDEHYIAALARLQDDRILKDGDTFAVFDQYGDLNLAFNEQGVFHEDTRFLSRLSILLDGKKPIVLGSVVRDDNTLLVVDLANPQLERGASAIRANTIHLQRTIFVAIGCCYEELILRNFSGEPIEVSLGYEFAADFRDIFEVRGEQRSQRGELHEPEVDGERVVLGYRGLDGILRRAHLAWSPRPDELSGTRALYRVRAGRGEETVVRSTLSCEVEGSRAVCDVPRREAFAGVQRRRESACDISCRIHSSNQRFDSWVQHSMTDLAMIMTEMPGGERYPYAGIPWYNTVFGRDGITIGLQTLWIAPSISRGVLQHLASRQADVVDPERDAEPGKIVHEVRLGEMARVGETPFREYYGTVDATLLFVLLAGEYYGRTGDLDFVRSIWPNVLRALKWMGEYGDSDGDGLIEYGRRSAHGLSNQGWKDSFDAVMHADGELAESPIALCEVQGYAYAGRVAAAQIADALGDAKRAAELKKQAATLAARFDDAFWCDEIGMYAMALDGAKRPCCVRSSNPGHCLYSGIVPPHRAQALTERLLAEDLFSGWGIRTLSTRCARYSPMSYHNGTVWPHDNSIIAAGFSRYGRTEAAMQVMEALFDASGWFDRHRLPELFCGFARAPGGGRGPTGYPVACSPQGWAAASVFLLVQAMLGMRVDASTRQVRLCRPMLPPAIDEVWIEGLSVAGATADLHLRRLESTVEASVLRQEGELALVVERK